MDMEIKDVVNQIKDVNTAVEAVNKLAVEIRAEVESKGATNGERFEKLSSDLQIAMAQLDELKRAEAVRVVTKADGQDDEYIEACKKVANFIKNPNDKEAKGALTYVSDITGAYAVGEVIANKIIKNEIASQPLLSIVDFAGTNNPNNSFPVDTSSATFRKADGLTTMPTINTQEMGKFLCNTHLFDGIATINPDLLADSDANIVETTMLKIQEAMALNNSQMILIGSGANDFEGITKNKTVLASQVVTSASTTLSVDEFKTFVYSLPAQYAKDASLVTLRSTVGAMASYKATTGSGYLWTPPNAVNPGAFDGIPVYEVADLDAWATGKTVAIIGNFKKYIVRSKLDLAIQFLQELYLPYRAWYYRYRAGGGVALPEAFKVLKVK